MSDTVSESSESFLKKQADPASPAVELPVFFASCRQAITSNRDDAGKALGPLQLGTATARVPAEKEWLEAPDDLNDNLEELGWQLNQKEPTLVPYLELRGYVAESDTKAVLKDTHVDGGFWGKLREEVKHEPDHRVYVYIHGFAASGENSVYSSGVLSSQVQAPVVSFNWPSAGKVGGNLFGPNSTRGLFKNERKLIDGPDVLNNLTAFLAQMKKELPPDTEINLVAHSLGNRLMTRYLDSNAKETFNSVYFLAPDVDKKTFVSAVPDILSKAKYVAVYVNPDDKVLGFSSINNWLELKSGKKLGKSSVAAPGIEFINYEEIAMPHGIGHYVPFQQFGSIVRTGVPYAGDPDAQQYFMNRKTKIEKKPKGAFEPVPESDSDNKLTQKALKLSFLNPGMRFPSASPSFA